MRALLLAVTLALATGGCAHIHRLPVEHLDVSTAQAVRDSEGATCFEADLDDDGHCIVGKIDRLRHESASLPTSARLPRLALSTFEDEGSGGYLPVPYYVEHAALGQAEPPVGSPSWLAQAYSYTASAPANANAFIMSTQAKFCLNGSTCTANITTSAGGSILIATPAGLFAGGGATALGATSNRWTALWLSGAASSSVANGSNAYAIETNGARVDFGTGAADYLTSDGSAIVVPTSGQLQLQTANGATGLAFTTNGARLDFGGGASDYASSDGTTVTFAGALASTGNFTANQLFSSALTFSSAGLPACTSANEGFTRRNSLTGTGTARRTAVCMCTYDGAGAASTDYDWVNLGSGTVGDETTCPD